jgi:hypothetical protein
MGTPLYSHSIHGFTTDDAWKGGSEMAISQDPFDYKITVLPVDPASQAGPVYTLAVCLEN